MIGDEQLLAAYDAADEETRRRMFVEVLRQRAEYFDLWSGTAEGGDDR